MFTAIFILSCVVLFVGQRLKLKYRKHLRQIPGPPLASFSNLWKVKGVCENAIHLRYVEAHSKYGPIVRIGPNHVSVASQEALQMVYTSKRAFPKSDFYKPTTPYHQGSPLPNLFSIQDVENHAVLKKKIAGLYTKVAAAGLENHVDACVALMLAQIGKIKGRIDMSMWLHFYSFDSLCMMSMSKTFGFLAAGQDVGGLLAKNDLYMQVLGFCSQAPLLQRVNELLVWLDKQNPLLTYIDDAIQERQRKPGQARDMLGSFLELQSERTDSVTTREITAAIYVNLIAGHDVVANALRAVFYYLARTPMARRRLQDEVRNITRNLEDSVPIPYADITRLSYLDAVVHESLRIHGNTGMMLERVVPAGGMQIDEYFLPAGTIVGCNSWVMHRNKDVFGQDVEEFRPERWLKKDAQHLAEMKRALFSFGAGSRTCIGRNVAWLQILKLIAEFYRRYDASLASPDKQWEVNGNWFTTQSGMDMLVSPNHEN